MVWKFPLKTWFFGVWTSFQLKLGGARWNKNLIYTDNIGKKMLFLACASVRNSLLKFLVGVMGAQICPPRQKTPKFGFQAYIFSRAWKWKGVVPNIFPRLFGMYLTPPDHQNIKIFFWRVATIFAKRHWFFVFLGLYIETPGLYLETRGSAGISRVKRLHKAKCQ